MAHIGFRGHAVAAPSPAYSWGREQHTGKPAFFDLDKTIIAKSSVMAFGRPFYQGGLINRRALLKSTYAQFVYLVGGADHDQIERMRAYLSQLCKGWDVEQVKAIVAETLHDLIDPLIYDEAAALIEEHHAAGRDVVIVSTSGVEVVEPIGEMLGADHVIATRMVVEDGRFTGEIDYYAYGAAKAAAVVELAAARVTTWPASLRLQRLDHRHAAARDGRVSLGRQPRPRAAQGSGQSRLAGAQLQQPGTAAITGRARLAAQPGLRSRRPGRGHGRGRPGLVRPPPQQGRQREA